MEELGRRWRPWTRRRAYLNFQESPAPATSFYSPETLDRLLALQAKHDPDRTIRSAHELN